MGRVGKALKQVLKSYGISQNKLAIAMEIAPANVSRWVNEVRDPTGDVIFEIKSGLEKLDPEAAEEFVKLYMYNKGEYKLPTSVLCVLCAWSAAKKIRETLDYPEFPQIFALKSEICN